MSGDGEMGTGLTHEAVGDGKEADAPRDAIARIAALVDQSGEDKFRGASTREEDERDDEGEEEDDMEDAAHQLNGGEEPDAPDVAGKGHDAQGLHSSAWRSGVSGGWLPRRAECRASVHRRSWSC